MRSSSRQPRKWTLSEDQRLREEVEAQLLDSGDVKDWCKVAINLPGRTNKDCRKRWHNSVAGGLKKGQWSKSEDALLANAVEQHGQKWTLVANCVESRSADQCAKRWQQSLDPDLDHSEWRDEEDRILLEATQQHGTHWKDIQREHFPGRPKNTIKNRYTVLVRRYQNQGITLPSRASSPSDSNTPAPLSYPLDNDFPYNTPEPYNSLMPPQTHRSWPSPDTQAIVPTWFNPQNYTAMNPPAPNMTHTPHTIPVPNYAMSPAPTAHWWTPPQPSNPIHASSHLPYNHHPHPPAPLHYDTYGMPHYTARLSARATDPGVLSNAVPASSMPRGRTWVECQAYDSLAADAEAYACQEMQGENPMYRF